MHLVNTQALYGSLSSDNVVNFSRGSLPEDHTVVAADQVVIIENI